MKEKFERFKNEKTVINVRSKKQYDDFMKTCEEQGLKWIDGDLPTKNNIYNDYGEETCIDLNNLMGLFYCNIDVYKNIGYKIIKYKDFIKEESNQFTKSDLKDNHIVVLRNFDKHAWYCIGYSYDYNLINIGLNCDKLYDIMEVWEFDRLVWKREEEPVEILDEVEENKQLKDKLNKIEKFVINYARDIEEKIFYEESDKPNHYILGDGGTELLINKINEIIDKLNELEKEKKNV